MTEEQLGGQKAADAKNRPMDLPEAVRIVNAAIEARTKRMREIANGKDHGPIEIIGDTETNYPATVQVDPAKACKIMLDFDEPIYQVLGLEYPVDLWDSLADLAGLRIVGSIDVDLEHLDD